LRVKDPLPVPPAVAEYSTGLSMGQTAEQMAKSHQISREAQDALAHRSHTLAAKPGPRASYGEVFTAHVPPYKSPLERDNNIRESSDLASYAKLKAGALTGPTASSRRQRHPAHRRRRRRAADARRAGPRAWPGAARLYPQLRVFCHRRLAGHADGPSYATPLALDRAGITLAI
jgi:acetyl-CoA acyltransferase